MLGQVLLEDLGLPSVQALDQIAIALGQRGRHPFLAAGDPKELRVLVVRPAQLQPGLCERLVERGEVQVALGVCDHAVAVEDQRSQAWPIVGFIGGSLWVQGRLGVR